MSERDDAAAAFYANPENREAAGPPVKRAGQGLIGTVASVRLSAEDAEELRWAAKESGKSASDLLRAGLGYVLPVIRADWYEKHGSEDDWEPVTAEAGQRKELLSQFSVKLTGDQLLEIAQAAEAYGVTISAYLREAGLALAAAQRSGGTARCGHFSMTGVISAECPECGPMPVALTVTAPGRPS